MNSGQKNSYSCESQPARGFTLVEMLLVLVILSTLAAIVYPNLSKQGVRGRITATKSQIQILRAALSSFEMDNDHFPRTGRLIELVQKPADAKNWRGPYLDKTTIPKDAWGHEFTYECPGKHNTATYDIASNGPDGQTGTADDITSWQQED